MNVSNQINSATNTGRMSSSASGMADKFSAEMMKTMSDDSGAKSEALASHGISMSDNSDVGPGQRFPTISDKLSAIMQIIMSMINSGGNGPTGGNETKAAFSALKS